MPQHRRRKNDKWELWTNLILALALLAMLGLIIVASLLLRP